VVGLGYAGVVSNACGWSQFRFFIYFCVICFKFCDSLVVALGVVGVKSTLVTTWKVLGILVLLSIYMHILNSFFSILTYYSKLMFYYFLPKICPEMLC
jgi:hypothetical protein